MNQVYSCQVSYEYVTEHSGSVITTKIHVMLGKPSEPLVIVSAGPDVLELRNLGLTAGTTCEEYIIEKYFNSCQN